MSVPKDKQSSFLNPYRQNKRWFNQYFQNTNINLSSSKDYSETARQFLDDISKASSIKVRQSPFQSPSETFEVKKAQSSASFFVIQNRKKNYKYENPEFLDLISKHIESASKKKQDKRIAPPLRSDSMISKKKNLSVSQLQKNSKITQFSRQTFYKNFSISKRSYKQMKQKQDKLHLNCNLDINSNKQSIHKKTTISKVNNYFVTYDIFILKNRVGIDAQILGGALKQIKFRLIMNQADTKTFNKSWKNHIDQFIEKCLSVNQDGISLKMGTFNFENLSQRSKSRMMNVQKAYMERCESVIKKNINRKISARKVGNKQFTQQYMPMNQNKHNQTSISQLKKDFLTNTQQQIISKQNQKSQRSLVQQTPKQESEQKLKQVQ